MMTKTNEAYQTRSKILILLPLTTILIAGISLINAPAQEKQPVEQNKQVKFVTPQNSTKSSKTNAAKQQPQVKFVPPVNQATEETSQYPPKASVSLTRMNVLYIGVDNPVTIAVANYNPREIKVTFDNGELKKLDNSNYNYIARPKSAGSANLFIYAGEKLIEKAVFRVKPVPDPVAQVAGRKGGEIDREILASQNEIDVVLQNFDFDMQFKITEFTLSVSKDGRSYDIHSNSNKITQEQKELIMNTTQDQKVYFLDIKCTGPDEQVRELLPVVFKIK